MNDLEKTLLAQAELGAELAQTLKLLADHVFKLSKDLAEAQAKIESLAFIQRAGKHA